MSANEIVRKIRTWRGHIRTPGLEPLVMSAADLIESLQVEITQLKDELADYNCDTKIGCKLIEKVKAEVMQLREAQRWTDAEYDTPDIGQAVLLYMPDKETDNIRAGEYMGEGDYRIGNKLYRGMEIDAWLPLPAAPEEGE